MKLVSRNLNVVLSVLVLWAFLAQTAEARLDQRRQRRQQARIGEGVQNGQLTPREARRLERGERRIDRAQERATADGVVTPKEEARLNRMENRQSRRIYKEKHDAQTATEPASAPQAQGAPQAQ